MLLCCFSVALLSAQTITLTFTGRVASQYVPLSRVVVSNLTKGWQETLIWPDTVLEMISTGIPDVETRLIASLQLSQNSPNPFDGTTFVNLQVVEAGDVAVEITDIAGRIVRANNYSPLQPGIYQMRVALSSPGLYFLTARQNGQTTSIKMVNQGNGGNNAIVFTNIARANDYSPLPQPKNGHRGVTENPFDLGDQMEYVGFAMLDSLEVESGHLLQVLEASQTIVLSFPNAQPCREYPTVSDVEGNVYHTVQIGNQCWMKENLRTTKFADSTSIPIGALYTSLDPHYYDDNTSFIPLEERGYLYNWSAAMHEAAPSTAVPSRVQGICPEGWHLPSEAEWEVLKSYVSSQPEYTCGGNAENISKALASTQWWESYNGTCNPGDQSVYPNNTTGFGAVPAGTFMVYGYNDVGFDAHFWSSTENYDYYGAAIYYGLDYDTYDFFWATCTKDRRASVRCLKD